MRVPPAVLLLVAAVAVLAGCGGGAGAEGATTAGATAAPAGAVRQAPDPVAGARDPWTHLRALSDVAAANGRTRAAGTPGGVATERLIAGRLRGAGWTVRLQTVGFPFF